MNQQSMETTIQEDLQDLYAVRDSQIELLEQIRVGDTTQFDEQTANTLLSRIADLQSRVDRIFNLAALEARPHIARIERIRQLWEPHLRNFGIEQIKAQGKTKDGAWKRKSVRLGAGTMFFVKKGGWGIADSAELRKHLLNNPTKMLELGLEITISLDAKSRTKILNHVKQTGEALPGLKYEPDDDFAVIKFGAEKAWSSAGAVETVKTALGRTAADHWEEAE